MKIFIVEGDRSYNKLIDQHLRLTLDFETETFHTGKAFLDKLGTNPDVIILDVAMADIDVHEVILKIRKYNPAIHLVLLSGVEDCSFAGKLLKEGAFDCVIKDENIKERLLNSIQNIHTIHRLQHQVKHLKKQVSDKYDYSKSIIGASKALKKVYTLIEKAIQIQNLTVSIRGESGTGKELVARTIHYNSIRKEKPFIAVNMGAIPHELLEIELFGHERGAFVGAYSRSVGKFEEANGGTIFFDEISEMELDLQAKLLRAIQEREIFRVGGTSPIKIDVRIITATDFDLLDEVKKGRFRDDLYYRLLGLPIILPQLSERDNDIILLASHFLNEFCTENNLPKKEFSPKSRNKLLTYHYPGNVRELKAVVELSVVMSNNGVIEEDDIMFSPTSSGLELFAQEMSLREYESKIIAHYLEKNNNNVVLVAKKLDIGKSKIYNMIKGGEL
jgi:DNA-binding NtrC family response regulator